MLEEIPHFGGNGLRGNERIGQLLPGGTVKHKVVVKLHSSPPRKNKGRYA